MFGLVLPSLWVWLKQLDLYGKINDKRNDSFLIKCLIVPGYGVFSSARMDYSRIHDYALKYIIQKKK